MKVQIVKEKISKEELARLTKESFGDMVKVDVDVKREILTIGGEWHSEGDELLSQGEGYSREHVWGVNFYPWNSPGKRIVYTSLVNIKPNLGYRTMEIQEKEIREKIHKVIEKLLLTANESLNV